MTSVSGPFEQLRVADAKNLEAAARQGAVEVRLWSDAAIQKRLGRVSEFPVEERRYVMEAVRFVDRVVVVDEAQEGFVADPAALAALSKPETELDPSQGARPKVVVTGCFDWLHSGHVRFFEESAEFGELTVVVGSDRNVSLLKGSPHPMFPEEERRYLVGAVRHVKRALISSGEGWMDAAPEIERLRADVYVVNEDGDKSEKRAFCEGRGIEYKVLKRAPAAGLPRRESTALRGF